MTFYGARQLAESFRVVRANTLTIADEIPEDRYGFRPAPELKTVAEQLAHIACGTPWQIELHGAGIAHVDFAMFGASVARAASAEQALTSKDAIVAALRDRGEEFAAFLDGLTDDQLGEVVTFPPPVKPASRTRFEMLLAAKEHEMHHRAQLMIYERLLGIVPHLTRRRMAAMTGGLRDAVTAVAPARS
jgi:uncharacterized damage-inducible protein DinB